MELLTIEKIESLVTPLERVKTFVHAGKKKAWIEYYFHESTLGLPFVIRFKDGKPVPPRTKDPKKRAEAIALGEAFLENPGSVVTPVNPELPDEAKVAARACSGCTAGSSPDRGNRPGGHS